MRTNITISGVQLSSDQASLIFGLLVRAEIENKECIEKYKHFDTSVFIDENRTIREIKNIILNGGEK